jgi:hypothetical protein
MFGEGGTYISVNYSFLRGLYGCKCAFIVLSLIVWGNQCIIQRLRRLTFG